MGFAAPAGPEMYRDPLLSLPLADYSSNVVVTTMIWRSMVVVYYYIATVVLWRSLRCSDTVVDETSGFGLITCLVPPRSTA